MYFSPNDHTDAEHMGYEKIDIQHKVHASEKIINTIITPFDHSVHIQSIVNPFAPSKQVLIVQKIDRNVVHKDD